MLGAEPVGTRWVAAPLTLGAQVEAGTLIGPFRSGGNGSGGLPLAVSGGGPELGAGIPHWIRIEWPNFARAAGKIINGYEPFHCAVRLASLESNFVSQRPNARYPHRTFARPSCPDEAGALLRRDSLAEPDPGRGQHPL